MTYTKHTTYKYINIIKYNANRRTYIVNFQVSTNVLITLLHVGLSVPIECPAGVELYTKHKIVLQHYGRQFYFTIIYFIFELRTMGNI